MNENGLIEQVLRIINANYSNIYVIDIILDKVYVFDFTVTNSLVIKETMTYTTFIGVASKFVHEGDLSAYFEALSLNKLEIEATKGNSETKIKYRKLCETGEYRWFTNIINYLPFEGKKLIFMMSEDINERLMDSETTSLKLESEISSYKKKMNVDCENISDALVTINNLLDTTGGNKEKNKSTKAYINSLFKRISLENPDLNKAIVTKMVGTVNYNKPSILIVDDSSIIRNSLKRLFSNEFNIIMAKDGNEAMQLIHENVVNFNAMSSKENIVAVLLDLFMPKCDGFAVLDYMKKNNLFSRIPVAIISGDETRETRKKAYEYEIVDMLEKPFNTEQTRRRISNIIHLYMSSNNLKNIVSLQNEELKTNDPEVSESFKKILKQIVLNVINNPNGVRLRKYVKVIATHMADKYPKYAITPIKIDYMVNTCALYNIGGIALPENTVVTGQTIRESIAYGESIAKLFVSDPDEFVIASNIIQNSCEMWNGTGYPNNLKGEEIPIEAQITNILIRLVQRDKSLATAIKNITNNEKDKYNPDLIDALNACKKELKEID